MLTSPDFHAAGDTAPDPRAPGLAGISAFEAVRRVNVMQFDFLRRAGEDVPRDARKLVTLIWSAAARSNATSDMLFILADAVVEQPLIEMRWATILAELLREEAARRAPAKQGLPT